MALATDRVLLVHSMRLESIGSRVDFTSLRKELSCHVGRRRRHLSCLDHDEEGQECHARDQSLDQSCFHGRWSI